MFSTPDACRVREDIVGLETTTPSLPVIAALVFTAGTAPL
jgi:hypothetical protein